MTDDKKIAFTKADYSALKEIADSLIPNPIFVDSSIKIAQELYEKGLYSSETGLEPKETFILSKIMHAVTTENFPPLLVVYLNDRNGSDLPEHDFATLLTRNTWAAKRKLLECVDNLVEKRKAIHKNVERS